MFSANQTRRLLTQSQLFGCLFALFLTTVPPLPAGEVIVDALDPVPSRLLSYFDLQLNSPEAYRKLALRESRMFPEGDIFPFVFPALGYAHWAMAHPYAKDNSIARMQTLIGLCITQVVAKVRPPGDDLLKLKTMPAFATHLGELNLILSYYRKIGGGDAGLLQLNNHLSLLILAAIEKSKGAPLSSYPSLTWPFDTVPCLVSLVLWNQELNRVQLAKTAHLQWLEKFRLDRDYKLPFSKNPATRPRGCDLTLRIALLKLLDEKLASEYYQRFRQYFWLERGGQMGFAEWPEGKSGTSDLDSGPIINGIGLAATGNGFAVTRAMGDKELLAKLESQLAARDLIVFASQMVDSTAWISKAFAGMGLTVDWNYYTGFLFGDAVLFGVYTWPMGDLASTRSE